MDEPELLKLYSLLIRCVIVYIVGMAAGFIFAAYKKGEWWSDDRDYYYGGTHHIPILMTLFWWMLFIGIVVKWIFVSMYNKFIQMLNFTHLQINTFDDRMKQRKNDRAEKKKSKAVLTPALSVREGYRIAAPKLCKACGVSIDHDQDDIEVVDVTKTNKDKYAYLDSGFVTHPND